MARAKLISCFCRVGQAAAAFADLRVITFIHLHDEFVRVDDARGFLDHVETDIFAAIGDVFTDRSAEQVRFLQT